MYWIFTRVGRSNGLNFVLVGGTAICNPTVTTLSDIWKPTMITLPHSCCTCKVITEREPIEWRRKKEERSRSSKGQYSGDGGRAENKRKKVVRRVK